MALRGDFFSVGFKRYNVSCAAWLLWGVQFAPVVSGLPVCVFVGWTPPFWDTLFPLPNCFLLSEQKLHMRRSGPHYLRQIQNHNPGHGWVQFSVTLWQFTPGKICLALFSIPTFINPRDVTAFSKSSSSDFPREGLRAVAFQRDSAVLGPSLQKALVFLTKGLWHPGSTPESSEFGKSELYKESLQ